MTRAKSTGKLVYSNASYTCRVCRQILTESQFVDSATSDNSHYMVVPSPGTIDAADHEPCGGEIMWRLIINK